MLTDLALHGVDNYAGLDWDLLVKLNPVLQGNYSFTSLTDEQVAYWLKRFAKPEFFVSVNGKLICVPVEEACQ